MPSVARSQKEADFSF